MVYTKNNLVLQGLRHNWNKKYEDFASLVNAQYKIKKTFVVLVYGHVYIIWSYLEAKIKSPFFYDISLIESL